MTMYLLLRNNKQSGPYSLEEMKSMGLKAYDLVWLEGKSAAWRYPCEIEELSPFAPAVEEQPFDRFFKRNGTAVSTPAHSVNTPVSSVSSAVSSVTSAVSSVTSAASVITSTSVNTSASAITSASVLTSATVTPSRPAAEAPVNGASPMMPGKRTIYVNLPAGRPPATPVRETPVRETARETPVRETVREAPVRETARETPIREVPRENPYATPLEVPDLPSHPSRNGVASVEFIPRRRSLKKERIFRILAVGVCILALLSAGIFIGLSLNKETLGLQQRIATKDHTGNVPAMHTATQPLQSPATGGAANTAAGEKPAGPAGSAISDQPSSANSAAAVSPVTRTPRTKRTKGRPAATLAVIPPVTKDSAPIDIPLVHREAVHRTDVAAPADNTDKDAIRSAIAGQVSVGGNKYSVGTFGGINDLQLTVTNRSVYPLDLVVVEVQYIQANKKIYKKEDLYFRDIGPGSALMEEAPRSSRGIRVQYKITSISSTKLGLSYSGL